STCAMRSRSSPRPSLPIINTSLRLSTCWATCCSRRIIWSTPKAHSTPTLTASMNRWKRTDAPAWRAARSASALGEALYRQGKKKDAEKYLLEGYQALTAETGADADTRNKARQRVVDY